MSSQRKNQMEMRSYKVRTYREGDERKIVGMLPSMHAIDRDRKLGVKYWTWKNKLSPHFDPSLVVIAEENGKVIGCAHARVRKFKISRTLTTRATQPADLFVLPEHRRRGIATKITSVLRKNLRASYAIVLFGVASPLVHKNFYSKLKGDKVFMIPKDLYCKTAYLKRLNCASFKRKASSINKTLQEHREIREELMRLDLTVLFRLKGYPPFALEISQGKVYVKEGEPVYRPNIVVTASRLSSSTKMLTLIKDFFSGDVKVRGLTRNFVTLYRCSRVMRKVNKLRAMM